jgi:hypothetical protein
MPVAGSRVLGLASLRLCAAEVARESCVFGAKPFRHAAQKAESVRPVSLIQAELTLLSEFLRL